MDINLNQHAVIEASAGTGKTYTIEQIVVRLLQEKNVPLDKILVVTFTEKATGELKERLRKTIGEAAGILRVPSAQLNLDGSAAATASHGTRSMPATIQDALDNFDQAPIFTIHGFCQRLLAEFVLEQGQDFRRELANDADMTETALREVQRRLWPADFGPELEQILELAGYNRDGAENWELTVSNLTSKYRQEYGNLLLPAADVKGLSLKEKEDECRVLIAKLRELAGEIFEDMTVHSWLAGLDKGIAAWQTLKQRREKVVTPLLLWLADSKTDRQPIKSCLELTEEMKVSLKAMGFPVLGFLAFFDKFTDNARNALFTRCPGLTDAIQALDDFHRKSGLRCLTHQLAVKTITAVRDKINELKTQRGLFSFDDMIIQVHHALDGNTRSADEFLATLRERFRYAIVDEFQDTDPLQWNIFKRIFLDGGDSRLIVVGDPKQAIFGFRGADLPTYLAAAKEMHANFGANKAALDTNWRSVATLLEPLNHLFEKSGWFAGTPVSYQRVKSPPKLAARTAIIKEPKEFPPFTCVDLRHMDSLKKARRRFAQFAVAEMDRLLAAEIKFTIKGKEKILDAGDICCLVFRKNEAESLIAELRSAGLPYTFYKQTGLWNSDEARHLGVILQALAQPEERTAFRKALLTFFFGLSPVDLTRCDDIPPTHAARVLFQQWLGHVEKREWSALAQSLLEDSGILFRLREDGDLDRVAGNLRFLLGALQEKAYRDNLDIFGLVEYFEKRRSRPDDLQGDLQPIETEEPKIKIMTVHAAKGLEFPVVFLAGGFTQKPHFDLTVYRDDSGRRVFDLDPTPESKERQKAEVQDESRRLLYVALTRAMLKVYVPLVSDREMNKGHAGPVCTLLRPALELADLHEAYPHEAALVEPNAVATPQPRPVSKKAAAHQRQALTDPLFSPVPANLERRRLVVQLFSSLHRDASPIQFGEEKPYAMDEGPDLPEDVFRGPVFGNLVHEVLESIDFAAVEAAAGLDVLTTAGTPLRQVLDIPIAKYLPLMPGRAPLEQLHEACVREVANLVWKALRTPLPGLGCDLAAIPLKDRIHELEFLFPEQAGVSAPAEVTLEEGFLTGFMDLVFRKDGLYYLLDWKTNALDTYVAAGIADAMKMSDYHRQYRLYVHALKRWLEGRSGPAFDFLKNFGGVYYLFLRGMSEKGNGIFYYRPRAKDLDLGLVLGAQ